VLESEKVRKSQLKFDKISLNEELFSKLKSIFKTESSQSWENMTKCAKSLESMRKYATSIEGRTKYA
jgi:hypothetical protein